MRLIWRTMSPPISLYRCPESHMMLISKTIGLITPYLVHGYFVSCFPGWSFAWIPGFEMEIISLPLKGACVISVWAANITGHLIHLDKLRRKHALIFYVFFFLCIVFLQDMGVHISPKYSILCTSYYGRHSAIRLPALLTKGTRWFSFPWCCGVCVKFYNRLSSL